MSKANQFLILNIGDTEMGAQEIIMYRSIEKVLELNKMLTKIKNLADSEGKSIGFD